MQNPNERQPSEEGWKWTDDDADLVTYKAGDDVKKVIIGSHEHYGRGVFILVKKSGKWVLDDILGRPQEIFGYELEDE